MTTPLSPTGDPDTPLPEVAPPLSAEVWMMCVDAFVVNPSVVSDNYFLGPSARPDLTGLQPGPFKLKHDFVPPVDVRQSFPWQRNPRIADPVTGNLKEGRIGVCVSWTLPKVFRAGKADAGPDTSSNITYPGLPDRFIVVRRITHSDPPLPLEEQVAAFVVESNCVRRLDSLAGLDLDVTASPFLDKRKAPLQQTETVMGRKIELTPDWDPTTTPTTAGLSYVEELTVLGNGHSLFVDYTPHNPNVFSIHDNMQCKIDGNLTPLTSAQLSYVVLGYKSHDFVTSTSDIAPSPELNMCHGVINNVLFHREQPPPIIEADKFASKFATSQPLGVGTDVLDAVGAILSNSNPALASAIESITAGIAAPESNAQLERADVSTTNFKSAHGGYTWRLVNKDEDPKTQTPGTEEEGSNVTLSPAQVASLGRLNNAQHYRDALARRKRFIKHLIFCEWWKLRSLYGLRDWPSTVRQIQCRRRAKRLLLQLKMVNQLLNDTSGLLNQIMKDESANGPFEKIKGPKFFSQSDPAFALEDMGHNSPDFFRDDQPREVKVMKLADDEFNRSWLEGLLSEGQSGELMDVDVLQPWATKRLRNFKWPLLLSLTLITSAAISDNISSEISLAERKILKDMIAEDPQVKDVDNAQLSWAIHRTGKEMKYSEDDFMFNSTLYWFGQQPWRPLFVEWEVEFTQVPLEFWELRHREDGTVNYRIRKDVDLSTLKLKSRLLSGRTVLLDHVPKTMATIVEAMFTKVAPEKLNDVLIKKEQQMVVEAFKAIKVQSGRLSGFTDHLLTLCQGAHVIPSEYDVNSEQTMSRGGDEAQNEPLPRDGIFTNESDLRLLYQEDSEDVNGNPVGQVQSAGGLDVTPYGLTRDGKLFADPLQTTFSRYKQTSLFTPVTHGQARFSKFNIVDRFSQVICAFDPRADQPPKPFHPHISNSLLCQEFAPKEEKAERANITAAHTGEESGNCDWFQIQPRINQDARVNASFMINDTKAGPAWRPSAFGENPISAWLLPNFHNRSLQVYHPDGGFIGEAFLPGKEGVVYWQTSNGRGQFDDVLSSSIPEADSKASSNMGKTISRRALLDSLSEADFLLAMWNVLICANDHIEPPPAAQFSHLPSSLVGRPIAVAHLALGLELATAPMSTQAYSDKGEPLPEEDDYGWDDGEEEIDLSETTGSEMLGKYQFGAKLGDFHGKHDGFIGFLAREEDQKWRVVTDYTPIPTVEESALAAGHHPQSARALHHLSAPPLTISPRYPKLLPYQAQPTLFGKVKIPSAVAEIKSYAAARTASYSSLCTVLLDPFLPVHIRTGILPVKTVRIQRGLVEEQVKKLRVWLKAGPVLSGANSQDPIDTIDRGVNIQSTQGSDVEKPLGVPIQTPSGLSEGRRWQYIQPILLPEAAFPAEDVKFADGKIDWSGEGNPLVDTDVEYVAFEVLKPLGKGEGFDNSVSIEKKGVEAEDKIDLGMATVLEGYLIATKGI